jgi:hypothetical protein
MMTPRNRRLVIASLATAATAGIASVAIALLTLEESRSNANGRGSNMDRAALFAQFRARPLRIPVVSGDLGCALPPELSPATTLPGVPAEAALGTGPVYVVFPAIPRVLDLWPPERGSPLAKSEWRSAETLLVSEPAYRGPVLVRGRQIDGATRIGFGSLGEPAWELRLHAGDWAERRKLTRAWGRPLRVRRGWRIAVAHLRIRREGCYFVQVDGASFSERIGFYTVLQP